MKYKVVLIFLLLIFAFINTASAEEVWIRDDTIVTGITDIGFDVRPAIFNDSGILKLISGENDGTFNGFYWSDSTWIPDSSIVNGLGGIGYDSSPEVFQMDGTWYLIAGEFDGGFYGWHWTGSAWTPDASIVNGLTDVLGESAPEVFNDSGTWKLISGENTNLFYAWHWSGSAWVSDSSIINGLGSAGYMSQLSIFDDSGIWKMIVGKGNGNSFGWYWTGSAWQSDPAIVNGLGDIGDEFAPEVFNDDGTWKLMIGTDSGNIYGWYFGELFSLSGIITNENGVVNNATITLDNSGGSTTSNETGYYEFVDLFENTYSIDVTEALHYDYSDTVTITSDTEKNIFLTIIPLEIIPIIVPPPVIPTQEPTPMIAEEIKLTIFEESIEKLSDLSILITNLIGKGLTWTFILASYVGALVSSILIKGKDEEEDSFDILLYGTIGWALLLLINFSGYIAVVTESFILNALIFGIAGFVIYAIGDAFNKD